MSYAPPGTQPTINGPSVSVVVDLDAEFLRTNAVDPSVVVTAVQVAVANTINATSTSATIAAASIAEIAASVPGVAAVLSFTLDGGDSFVGDGSPEPYLLIPGSVALTVRTIR